VSNFVVSNQEYINDLATEIYRLEAQLKVKGLLEANAKDAAKLASKFLDLLSEGYQPTGDELEEWGQEIYHICHRIVIE